MASSGWISVFSPITPSQPVLWASGCEIRREKETKKKSASGAQCLDVCMMTYSWITLKDILQRSSMGVSSRWATAGAEGLLDRRFGS